MKKRPLQSFFLQTIYKGVFQWFLKIIVGVQFGDNKFLKNEEQFIILANHNSHLDTLCLLASLPRKIIWKVKPVAAEDYFGNTRLKASLSNYFINTLLIKRKITSKEEAHNPIDKMLEALDAGYSLILFPEGSRGAAESMDKLKTGIARILSARPHIKYVPTYLTGMGRSLPKGELLILPYKSSVNFGEPTLPISSDQHEIMKQIISDFEALQNKYQIIYNEDE